MVLRKQLREAEQEMKRFSKSNHRALVFQRKSQTSSSESATPPAESGTPSDQSTIIFTPSPPSDNPQSQYALFSPQPSPNSSLFEPQSSQLQYYSDDDACMDSDVQIVNEDLTPNDAPQPPQNLR